MWTTGAKKEGRPSAVGDDATEFTGRSGMEGKPCKRSMGLIRSTKGGKRKNNNRYTHLGNGDHGERMGPTVLHPGVKKREPPQD